MAGSAFSSVAAAAAAQSRPLLPLLLLLLLPRGERVFCAEAGAGIHMPGQVLGEPLIPVTCHD